MKHNTLSAFKFKCYVTVIKFNNTDTQIMLFIKTVDKSDNVDDFYTKLYDVYVKDCYILRIQPLSEEAWDKSKRISTQQINTWKKYAGDLCVNVEDQHQFVYDNLQFKKYGENQYFINKKCKERVLELIEDTKISLPYDQQIEYYYQNGLLKKQRELIVRLHGGFGNRLFQIASTYGIAKKYDYSFSVYLSPNPHSRHNYDWILNRLHVETVDKPTLYEKIVEPSEDCLTVSESLLEKIKHNKHSKLHLFGYFQCEMYFKDYIRDIVRIFEEPKNIRERIGQNYSSISEKAFVHVRLGDIVNHSKHWVDCTEYYKQAMNTEHEYLLFSDQPSRVAEFYPDLMKSQNVTIVDEDEILTLYLMKYCGLGGVAPNSTFSWWGLFLNMHKKTMIAPKYFMPSVILNHHNGKNDHYAEGFTVINV